MNQPNIQGQVTQHVDQVIRQIVGEIQSLTQTVGALQTRIVDLNTVLNGLQDKLKAAKSQSTTPADIATTQVNSDWNAVSGVAEILNKPVITPQVNADWNAAGGVAQILNKPSIAAQVNSDWNAIGGVSLIVNKPSALNPTAHHISHQNGGTDEIATVTPAANAIPKADAGGKLPTGFLGAGAANSGVFLRGDQTWASVPAVGSALTFYSSDAGSLTGAFNGESLAYTLASAPVNGLLLMLDGMTLSPATHYTWTPGTAAISFLDAAVPWAGMKLIAMGW